MKTLIRQGWRYLLRRPWQTLLMVLGITLGVAVMVAIDLANASASRAFDLSTEAVSGRATHQITAGARGIDETLYTRLRLAGLVDAAAPVVSEYVTSPQLGDIPLQLFGVDPFAEPPFRSYLGDIDGGVSTARPAPTTGDLIAFLTEPGAVFISTDLAERYGLEQGQEITLMAAGKPQPAWIAGLLVPADSLSSRALEGLILADVATAQEILGRSGRIDRIDLILPGGDAGAAVERALQDFLPAGVHLSTVEARTGTVAEMTRAFNVNLTALSLLALVVGMFLIYNTMTFSVVQRRPLFGTLRCLGATRRQIFLLVLIEAVGAGLLGSLLGLLLGVIMGQGAVKMVTRTINDLFFVVTVTGVQVPASSLVKGALIGLAATLLSAAAPAWEAASAPPRQALSRANLESKARRGVTLAAAGGLALAIVGTAILLIPTQSLVVSFAGTFSVVIGFAMVAPLLTRVFMRLVVPVLGRLGGVLGRLAPREAINSLSRTSIAVAALMVAVSVTIGVSLMVGSFRQTVIAWLDQTLQGDVYISAPGIAATTPTTPVDPAVIADLEAWPGVESVLLQRATTVESGYGPLQVAAINNSRVHAERLFKSSTVPLENLWERMQTGAVLVSEPLSSRLGLQPGDSIHLFTPQGERDFPIAAVYYDYASTQGTVLMSLDLYRQLWDDTTVTSVSLRLEPGQDADSMVRQLQEHFSGGQTLVIRANRSLRQAVLVVFDRTFAITGALQLLATVVAFIGVLSALLSLELERQRELGILRAIGLTIRQVWSLIMLETGLLGGAAGLLAMPTGYALAVILIYIINKRSFGWTLQMQVVPQPFLTALLIATTAALLAGIYPAWRMSRRTASDSIRFD